jgi:hypothetical protein
MKIVSERVPSRDEPGKKCRLELEGSAEEIALIKAALRGVHWISGKGNSEELVKHRRFPDINPPMVADPLLERFWPPGPARYEVFKETDTHTHQFASIYVHHICGYSGISEYNTRAKKLCSAGFSCLRSQRGDDGQIWEVWYLPNNYFAEGPIAGKKVDEIRSWLFNNVEPGIVDIANERWGMSID